MCIRDSTDTGMFRGAANQLGFSTAGTERLTIKSDGNVGIGTVTPDGHKLHVHGNSIVGDASVSNSTSFMEIRGYGLVGKLKAHGHGVSTSGATIADSIMLEAEASAAQGLVFAVAHSTAPIRFYGNGNKRLEIDSTGESTFTSNNATVEIATTTNGTYGVRSTSPAKFNDYYFSGTTGHIRNTLGTSYMSFDASGNATIPKNLTVQGSLTAQEFITELNTITIIESSGSTKFGNDKPIGRPL